MIAAHEAELRRIEQDLQDGTQARLVSLSMRLALAKRTYEHDPATAHKLLDLAQDQAEEALTELRHVVRGIHPPILTDGGLAGAVRALAASSSLKVTVDTSDLETGPRRASRQPPTSPWPRPRRTPRNTAVRDGPRPNSRA